MSTASGWGRNLEMVMIMADQPDSQYKLSRVSGSPVTDAELLDDLKRVANLLNLNTASIPQYKIHGKYNETTISRRFGSWNKALLAAGLSFSNEVDIPEERLFENILVLWQHYGRQPRRAELAHYPSEISQSPYSRRFGSWTAALMAFVDYANASGLEQTEKSDPAVIQPTRSCREPNLRLRWRVLQRDRFTCCCCGASPAKTQGIELHVDHIQPWSKGGETIEQNLQTLCSKCNLGKSDLCMP